MILSFRIKQIVDGLLDYIQQDYDSNRERDTILYQMFHGVVNGQFDFYQQAKGLFLRGAKSPRRLTTTFEYPKDRPSLPCIVIRESSKKFEEETLGGIGYEEYLTAGRYSSYDQRETFTHATASSVNLMCFSDNTLESLMVGEVLYRLLWGAHNTFEAEFYSFSFELSEIMVENAVFPVPLIIKNITMNLKYRMLCPSIVGGQTVLWLNLGIGRMIIGYNFVVGGNAGKIAWELFPSTN